MQWPRVQLGCFATLMLVGCPSDDGGRGAVSGSGSASGVTNGSTSHVGSTSSGASTGGASGGATSASVGSSSGDGSSSSGGDPIDPGTLSFFVTSVGNTGGGDFGGLAGADARCQALADATGSTYTWAAYLSTDGGDARDRIGTGPWWNAMGDLVAMDVQQLHADGVSNGDLGGGEPQHIYDENAAIAPMNEHDILTGSNEDGTLRPGFTCADWTSESNVDEARVGHSDIPQNPASSRSWNSAHDTQGCSPVSLAQTGGAGRLYCFATNPSAAGLVSSWSSGPTPPRLTPGKPGSR